MKRNRSLLLLLTLLTLLLCCVLAVSASADSRTAAAEAAKTAAAQTEEAAGSADIGELSGYDREEPTGYIEPTDEPEYETHAEKMSGQLEAKDSSSMAGTGHYSGVELPSSYIARHTSPKDQDGLGTCWIFGMTGMLESAIMTQRDVTDVDFSEMHATYATSYDETHIINAYNGTREYWGESLTWAGNGGNEYPMFAYWARNAAGGPVDDALLRYPVPINHTSAPYKTLREIQELSEQRSEYYPAQMIALGGNSLTDQTTREKYLADTKDLIYTFGGVAMSYYSDSSYYFYYDGYAADTTQTYTTFCNTDSASTNHKVMIVGWDDNYPKEAFAGKASHDGAFLVKNSWGVYNTSKKMATDTSQYKYYRYNGYHWMSYDSFYSKIDAVTEVIDRDMLGDITYETDTGARKYITSHSGPVTLVRSYIARSSKEQLHAVTLYNYRGGTGYRLFYTDANMITSSTKWTQLKVATDCGMVNTENGVSYINESGYATLRLSESVPVSGRFYVAAVLEDDDYIYIYGGAEVALSNTGSYIGYSAYTGDSSLNSVVDSPSRTGDCFILKAHCSKSLALDETEVPKVIFNALSIKPGGNSVTYFLDKPWGGSNVNPIYLPVYASSYEGNTDMFTTAVLDGQKLTITVENCADTFDKSNIYEQVYYVGFCSSNCTETRIPLTISGSAIEHIEQQGSFAYDMADGSLTVANNDAKPCTLLVAMYSGDMLLRFDSYTIQPGENAELNILDQAMTGRELRCFILNNDSTTSETSLDIQ